MRMLSFQWMSFKCNFFRKDVSHYEVIIISWSVTFNNCAFKRKCTRGLMYRPARIKVRISGNNPIFFYFIQTMTQENDQPNLRTLFWCWPIIHVVHKETDNHLILIPGNTFRWGHLEEMYHFNRIFAIYNSTYEQYSAG